MILFKGTAGVPALSARLHHCL